MVFLVWQGRLGSDWHHIFEIAVLPQRSYSTCPNRNHGIGPRQLRLFGITTLRVQHTLAGLQPSGASLKRCKHHTSMVEMESTGLVS